MMKKIINLCFASFLLTVVAFGQEASTAQVKKACTPTKECAEKMGISLEQCKALCKKTCAKSTSTAAATTSEARLVNTTVASDKASKKCCSSMKECAAKMGMTVEECKAKCKGHGASASTSTAVASAVMVKSVDVAPTAEPTKKACATKKACCKKKQ